MAYRQVTSSRRYTLATFRKQGLRIATAARSAVNSRLTAVATTTRDTGAGTPIRREPMPPGRAVRRGKSGYIPGSGPPIPDRLGIDPQQYLSTMSRGGNRFGAGIGSVDSLKRAAERLRQRYIRGVGEAKLLFQLLPT
jgi:hypothetical protein